MAVVISGASGTWSHGSSVTISGSGFGTNAATQEWTSANIEAGTPGALFTKTRWIDSNTWSPVLYANDYAYSGTKSLKTIVDTASNWNGLTTHQLETQVPPGGMLYVTWWTRYVGGTNGQWKMLRLSQANTVVDGQMECVFFNWLTGSTQIVLHPNSAYDQTYYPGSSVFCAQGGTWYRQEVTMMASSAGVNNGSVVLARYGGGQYNSYTASNARTHISASDRYAYAIFQNYFGNGITGFPTVWLEDIYITNSIARVELANASTWALRTSSEIQPWSTWTDGSVSVTVNTGALTTGQTRYLYIIDATGQVNANGYPVVIDSSATVIAPIAQFDATPLSGQSPLLVSYRDLSANTPTSWSWNLGQSAVPATSTEQNANTTYAYGGAKTVTLTVANSAGSDAETKMDYVTVRYLKPTNFQAN